MHKHVHVGVCMHECTLWHAYTSILPPAPPRQLAHTWPSPALTGPAQPAAKEDEKVDCFLPRGGQSQWIHQPSLRPSPLGSGAQQAPLQPPGSWRPLKQPPNSRLQIQTFVWQQWKEGVWWLTPSLWTCRSRKAKLRSNTVKEKACAVSVPDVSEDLHGTSQNRPAGPSWALPARVFCRASLCVNKEQLYCNRVAEKSQAWPGRDTQFPSSSQLLKNLPRTLLRQTNCLCWVLCRLCTCSCVQVVISVCAGMSVLLLSMRKEGIFLQMFHQKLDTAFCILAIFQCRQPQAHTKTHIDRCSCELCCWINECLVVKNNTMKSWWSMVALANKNLWPFQSF